MQSRVEELEDVNSSLRERDKVKDDAISHLSDQLISISTRLQELEKTTTTNTITTEQPLIYYSFSFYILQDTFVIASFTQTSLNELCFQSN